MTHLDKNHFLPRIQFFPNAEDAKTASEALRTSRNSYHPPPTSLPPIHPPSVAPEIDFLTKNRDPIEAYFRQKLTNGLWNKLCNNILLLDDMRTITIDDPEELEFLDLFHSLQRLYISNKKGCLDDSPVLSGIPSTVVELHLSGFRKFTVGSSESFPQQINVLSLKRCSAAALCLSVRNLKRVTFTECTTLNDHELIAWSKSHPHLKSISIEGSPNITDEGIARLCRNCPSLRYLKFSGTPRITGDTIKGDSLLRVELHEPQADIMSTLQSIQRRCPSLKWFQYGSMSWEHKRVQYQGKLISRWCYR